MASIPRLGVLVPKQLRVPDFLDLCVQCEQVGLDGVWLAEDCFTASGPSMAAMVLERTTALHVGLGILPAAPRNVAFTAMEIATLANAHPGRITVGIGHGMPDWMRQIGAWPASPVTALEETLQALRALLGGNSVTMSGAHVRLDDVRLEQPPERVPTVLAGVRGPKSLAAAARSAEGTILCEPSAPEYIRAAVSTIAAELDDPASGHRIVAYNWFAADLPGGRAALRAALADSLSATQRAQVAPLKFGAELLARAAASDDPTGAWLDDEWLPDLAVVGGTTEAAARIGSLAEAGADTCVLVPIPGLDAAATVRAAGDLRAALHA